MASAPDVRQRFLAELSFSALQTVEETETVFVSPISFWEITNKVHQGKLTLGLLPREWFVRVCSRHALSILPLTPEILIRAGELPDIFPMYGVAVVS